MFFSYTEEYFLYIAYFRYLYFVLDIAEHTETGEMMVVYKALYGDYKTYVRPYDMFASEVNHEKYPDVEQKYRFELIPESAEFTLKSIG